MLTVGDYLFLIPSGEKGTYVLDVEWLWLDPYISLFLLVFGVKNIVFFANLLFF